MADEESVFERCDLDVLFSILNILNIVSETDEFRSWLQTYHHIYSDEHLYTGYQFFLDAVVCLLIDAIESETAFGLQTDYALYRAGFAGIPLNDVPVSCDKTKLIKNIWEHYRAIRNCKAWGELSHCISKSNVPVFETFDFIFSDYVVSKTEKPKEQALWEKTLNYTLIFFNDTRQGKPYTYPGTFLSSFISEDNFDKVFFGYVYTLQYLWFKLLGEEEFIQSPARDLHRALELYEHDDEDDSDLMFLCDYISPLENEVCKRWDALDRFFGKVNLEIVEIKVPSDREDPLILSESFTIQHLNPLMTLSSITEPDYLSNYDDFPSLTKKLDSFFFWHEMDVLDTNKIHIFNGASAFVSVLIGEVEKYRIFNNPEPIWVSRIKHPVAENKNDISYGILLQSGGLFTDTSGWLLFLDCGTDYSGSGGHIHAQIESFIERYVSDDAITVKEISVVSDDFIQYLRQKRIPSLVREIKCTTLDIIEHSDNYAQYQPAHTLLKEIQSLEGGDIEEISEQIKHIVFNLQLCIPDKPEHSLFRKRIDDISMMIDIPSQLEGIASLLPFIPYIAVSDQLSSIDSRLEELQIRMSPRISSRIIVSTGVELLGTGGRYEIEIPLKDIAYPELSEDIKMIKENALKMKDLPCRLKNHLVEYIGRSSDK